MYLTFETLFSSRKIRYQIALKNINYSEGKITTSVEVISSNSLAVEFHARFTITVPSTHLQIKNVSDIRVYYFKKKLSSIELLLYKSDLHIHFLQERRA